MAIDGEEIAQEDQSAPPSILAGISPQRGQNYLNTNDVSDNSQFLSPAEQSVYDQYQQQNQASQGGTGALQMHDYYPGYGNYGAVGTSSGSIIGTQSLFGGGGALIPIGMMDARDAALTRASLQKQKEVEDFRKQFKAPTSKLTGINEGLTDEYYNHVQGSWKKALKKSNGDPNLATQYLKNDTDFWKKEKSYQDLAKRGDAVVNKIAEIETRHKAGDVLSPALLEAKSKVLMDMNPDSKEFKNLSGSILRMDADREFSDAANEALMRAVTNETGQVIDKSNPDSIRIYKSSVEQLSPETKAAVIEGLKKIYDGSTMYSPEYIERNAGGMMNYKKTKEDLHVSQKRENNDTYDDKNIVSESGEKIVSRGQAINSYTEHYVPANANDQKKELKFAISKDMVAADGSPVNAGESGYIKGSVQGIGVKPFYKKENRFLTDEEVDAVKKRGDFEKTDDIVFKPTVIFNVTSPKVETMDSEGNTVSVPGEQKTVYFDTNKLAGIFKSSGNSKKDYESMRDKTEKFAEEKNKAREANIKKEAGQTKTSEPSKKSIKEGDISAKAEASGYSEKEYKALLKKNGVEIVK